MGFNRVEVLLFSSADARVEPRRDIRADVRPALGYSDSELFSSSVLWSLLSTWCGAEVCMLGWAYVVATNAWRASLNKKESGWNLQQIDRLALFWLHSGSMMVSFA